MKRHALVFGLVGGLLIAALQYTQYRFIVIEHSLEIYGALVATLFSAFGIWLGRKLTRERTVVHERLVVKEILVPVEVRLPGPFSPDRTQQKNLGITERELEVLAQVAGGLSNREVAAFHLRKHSEDALCSYVRQAGSFAADSSRSARQGAWATAVACHPKG